MWRSMNFWRISLAVVGICLMGGCADTTPSLVSAAARNEPQLAGAWYQVYFEPDSAEINSRGNMILQTVANVVKGDDDIRVSIVGKADSVGAAAANNQLSQLRARHVRDALIALAVPSARIDTSWVGERKLEVATLDNVAEQRNRVVDIAVQHPF